jgi:hypothetical protein
MAYLLADINRSSSEEYSYNPTTDTHTFISNGATVGDYAGTYLRGFPTRDLLFENRVTVHQVDLGDFSSTGEYIIIWAMDSPDGAEADYNITGDNSDRIADGSTTESYSGRRSEGFGIAASLQLRMISGSLNVCFVQGSPSNATTITEAPINVDGEGNYVEFYIRAIFQRSTNSVTDPVEANGRLKVSGFLSRTEANTNVGWNGAWRYLPHWGCILQTDVAARGNENKVSFREIEQGNTYTTDEAEENTSQVFTQVLGNPDRVYST